jgi:ABC-type multidrug transport system fused ATPase/permease subunit
VPQLVQNIIDSIITNAANQVILDLPEQVQTAAAERLGLDLSAMAIDLENAPRAIVMAGLIVVAFAVARGLFTFSQTFLAQTLSQNIAFELRNDLFAKIQRLSFSYHDKNRTGQLMIRATDDVERLRLFLGQGLLMAVSAVILLVGTMVILLLTNFELTLVVLPILPLSFIIFSVFGARIQPLFGEVQRRLSRVNDILQENLAGLKVVKAFAKEPAEKARFDESIDHLLEQRIKVARTFTFLFPLFFLIANMGQAAILYFGGRQIIDGTLTIGEWQKFSLAEIRVALHERALSRQQSLELVEDRLELGFPLLGRVGVVEESSLFVERQPLAAQHPQPRLDRAQLRAQIRLSQRGHLLVACRRVQRDIVDQGRRLRRQRVERHRIAGRPPRGIAVVGIHVVGVVLADLQDELHVTFGNLIDRRHRSRASRDRERACKRQRAAKSMGVHLSIGYDTSCRP